MIHVLLLAEAVTWSQVVRLVALGRSLDRARFRVSFASARVDESLLADAPFERHEIRSLTPAEVDARIRRGGRIYDRATLARYVDDERRLFDRLRPDVVVSDLRWSTTISAPVAGVPLATLIDAYWFRGVARYPIPDHPVVRWLGVDRVGKGFAIGLPYVLKYFAGPVNALRVAHGLSPFDDLRDVLGFGDRLLFPDDPALVRADRDGVYLGAVPWSPRVALPAEWDALGRARPLVYVTLGSSGAIEIVPNVLAALATLDVDVLLSTARRFDPSNVPANVRVAEIVPGDLAAAKSTLVVCSGGASTAWQAIAAGRPVVGIPSNLDACLAMACVDEAGAGVTLRPSAKVPEIRASIARALHDSEMHAKAAELAASAAKIDPFARFEAAITSLVAASRAPSPEDRCAP
jgi:UDP:flavonoid glycosyltransferase YjiC (YdhE family)